MIRTWLMAYGAGQLLLLLQGLFSISTMMFSPGMMRFSATGHKGIPFLAHGGMWMDGLCLTPLLATLVALYADQWSQDKILVAFAGGFVASAVMHWTYVKAPYQEAHVSLGRLTVAGWLHAVYMALAFTVIILFYTSTGNIPPALVLLTSFYLVGHVLVGVHFPMKLLRPDWFPPYPAWDLGTWLPVLGSAVVLGGASWFALR